MPGAIPALLLQTSRLHLPQSSEARLLAKELLEYELRIESDANDRYGAFRVGKHDELVTALGMAVCDCNRSYSVVIRRR